MISREAWRSSVRIRFFFSAGSEYGAMQMKRVEHTSLGVYGAAAGSQCSGWKPGQRLAGVKHRAFRTNTQVSLIAVSR